MVEKTLELLMLVFWAGLALGAVSAAVPALAPVAHWIAWAAGNGVALLALAATVGVVVGGVLGLTRRGT